MTDTTKDDDDDGRRTTDDNSEEEWPVGWQSILIATNIPEGFTIQLELVCLNLNAEIEGIFRLASCPRLGHASPPLHNDWIKSFSRFNPSLAVARPPLPFCTSQISVSFAFSYFVQQPFPLQHTMNIVTSKLWVDYIELLVDGIVVAVGTWFSLGT